MNLEDTILSDYAASYHPVFSAITTMSVSDQVVSLSFLIPVLFAARIEFLQLPFRGLGISALEPRRQISYLIPLVCIFILFLSPSIPESFHSMSLVATFV